MGLPPERLRFLEALDERSDHRRVVVLDQERDVVLDRDAGLVPARHDVAQTDRTLLHQVLADRVTEAAALRDHADGARPQRLDEIGAEGGGAEPDVEDAVAIRPADEQAALGGESLELGLALAAWRPGLGEPAREHDGRAHAAIDGRGQDGRYLLGRNRDDHGVGGLRCRGEVGIAGHAEHLRVLRIDRKDAAGVTESLEIGDDPGRAAHPLRGADDGNARRLHQRAQAHGRHGSPDYGGRRQPCQRAEPSLGAVPRRPLTSSAGRERHGARRQKG